MDSSATRVGTPWNMVVTGLLVRLDAKAGREADVEDFLVSALRLVEQEPATTAWFAVRFGRSDYGIVGFFPDEDGRQAHIDGLVAKALTEQADELFSQAPVITPLDVLADKVPQASASPAPVTKGLLLVIRPKVGKEADVEQLLRDAQPIVEEEPQTVAWFAIKLADGSYGIFDVFPDNSGRFAHLVGRVPRDLARNAMSLLGGFPDMDMLNVFAAKLP